MNKKLLFSIIIGLVILVNSNAHAASSVTSEIDYLQANASTSIGVVRTKTRPSRVPSCSDGRYVFDVSTDSGKVIYSTLMAAQISSKTIEFHGSGGCGSLSGGRIENLSFIRIY